MAITYRHNNRNGQVMSFSLFEKISKFRDFFFKTVTSYLIS